MEQGPVIAVGREVSFQKLQFPLAIVQDGGLSSEENRLQCLLESNQNSSSSLQAFNSSGCFTAAKLQLRTSQWLGTVWQTQIGDDCKWERYASPAQGTTALCQCCLWDHLHISHCPFSSPHLPCSKFAPTELERALALKK